MNDEMLNKIIGGNTTLSVGLMNGFVKIIDILLDVGRGLGSSVRRLEEDNICPVK